MATREDLEEQIAALEKELADARQELATKRAEQWLFESVLEHTPLCIQVYDRHGFSIYMNSAQERFLGMPDREQTYGVFNVLQDEGMIQNGIDVLFQRAFDGKVVNLPDRRVDLNAFGQEWDLSKRAAYVRQVILPIFDQEGDVAYVASFHWDVTRVREAESTLAAIERHDKLGLLAGGIAHDFNNMLMSILANVGLALAEDDKDEESLQDIETAALQAADLTSQLLAYSGRSKPMVRGIHLSDVVAQMVRLVEAAMPKNAQFLTVNNTREDVIHADVTQLRQVVLNLLTNAAEALKGKPGVVRVSTEVEQVTELGPSAVGTAPFIAGEYVCLKVTDDGAGIARDDLNSIFDPFFTTRETGQGLGLATTLGIVKAHGGAIEVDSTEGDGTSVTVYFPASDGEVAVISDVPPAAIPSRHATILVVEDEPLVRNAARRALEHRGGYTVFVARNGANALEQLEKLQNQDPVELILLDVSMPVMGGRAALRAIRQQMPDVRVILMSGRESPDLSDPPNGFLRKPFTIDELLVTVATVLDSDNSDSMRSAQS